MVPESKESELEYEDVDYYVRAGLTGEEVAALALLIEAAQPGFPPKSHVAVARADVAAVVRKLDSLIATVFGLEADLRRINGPGVFERIRSGRQLAPEGYWAWQLKELELTMVPAGRFARLELPPGSAVLHRTLLGRSANAGRQVDEFIVDARVPERVNLLADDMVDDLLGAAHIPHSSAEQLDPAEWGHRDTAYLVALDTGPLAAVIISERVERLDLLRDPVAEEVALTAIENTRPGPS